MCWRFSREYRRFRNAWNVIHKLCKAAIKRNPLLQIDKQELQRINKENLTIKNSTTLRVILIRWIIIRIIG